MITQFKIFERKEKSIEIVGYPEGNIIEVSQEELEELESNDYVSWDDEIDYEEGTFGQWSYDMDMEEEIEEWLKYFRDSKKYNL